MSTFERQQELVDKIQAELGDSLKNSDYKNAVLISETLLNAIKGLEALAPLKPTEDEPKTTRRPFRSL